MSESYTHRSSRSQTSTTSSSKGRQIHATLQEWQNEPRPPSNLNLRHNDNSFHVLASLLVEFFQAKIAMDDNNKTLTMIPDDRETIQRLLPKSAVWDFIDAVNYRLEVTPVVAVTPIHFLTLQCQELCLDREEPKENPILVTYSLKHDPVEVLILTVLSNTYTASVSRSYSSGDGPTYNEENNNDSNVRDYKASLRKSSVASDEDDHSDGFVRTKGIVVGDSSDLSSDGSTIKVASSKDIADEMNADHIARNAVDGNCNSSPNGVLSEDDSMPTSHSEDEFEELTAPNLEVPLLEEGDKFHVESEDEAVVVVEHSDAGDNDAETRMGIPNNNVVSNGNFMFGGVDTRTADERPAEVDEDEKSIRNMLSNAPIAGGTGKAEDREGDSPETKTILTEKIHLDDDEKIDEGEEIEVLPSVTNTIDEQDDAVYDGTFHDNEGEEIEVIPTEIYNESVVDLVIDDRDVNIAISHDAVDAEIHESSKTVQKELKESSNTCSSIPTKENHSTKVHISSEQQHDPVSADTPVVVGQNDTQEKRSERPQHECEAVADEHSEQCRDVSFNCIEGNEKHGMRKAVVDRPVSPMSYTTNRTNASSKNGTRSIQEAAGAFFDDLRWAIDEKIIAFEDAVVDAIVAKPIKRVRNDTETELVARKEANDSASMLMSNDSEICSKQRMFEDVVRDQIPEADPFESKKVEALQAPKDEFKDRTDISVKNAPKSISPTSVSIQSGIGSFFAGIAAGFTPSVKGCNVQNERPKDVITAFQSDEGNVIGSHFPAPDFSYYESMTVTDTATKQQLLLELKEACTLMKQSIIPETTRFWHDHIQTLQCRLDDLRLMKQNEIVTETVYDSYHVDSPDKNNNQLQSNNSTDLLETQSPAAMSEVRSINGIPVVHEISQIPDAFGCHEVYHQHSTHLEIELSRSRSHSEPRACDFIDTSENNYTPQPLIENEESYYEYPLVDVVAPADLPGGYHFEAEIEGQRFLATVPPGGVQQGETFTCYMRELDSVAIDIPVGDWKDGLRNMCELGWCHPVLWNAMFCPLVALGQIQTRVNLDFLGRPKFSELPYSNRFMMLTVIVFWIFTNVALFVACNLKWSRGLELSVADGCAFALVNVMMLGFVVFVTQSTRSSVREKFMIRERRCYDLEDVCCATLCLPCTVGQMSRHTANYDDYEAVCCSKTGLPNGVRVNQEPAKVKDTVVENDDGYLV
jgi:Cys-rich protein (TIGR01571 family)